MKRNENSFVITHKCGHKQVISGRAAELWRKGEKIKGEGFIQKQADFLERNLCPGCYRESDGIVY